MNHNTVGEHYERPWGSYQTLSLDEGYQVKILKVNAGASLSLQRHFKRSEHWVVVRGRPTLTLGVMQRSYKPDESLYIPVEAIHRISNPTQEEAVIIEVQIGDYLGEDDIERLEDSYGRS